MFTLNHTVWTPYHLPRSVLSDDYKTYCFINRKNKRASQSDFVADDMEKKSSIVSKGKFLTFLS